MLGWLVDHVPAIVALGVLMTPFAIGLYLLVRDARRAVRDPYEQETYEDFQDRDWQWPRPLTLVGQNNDARGAVTPGHRDHKGSEPSWPRTA